MSALRQLLIVVRRLVVIVIAVTIRSSRDVGTSCNLQYCNVEIRLLQYSNPKLVLFNIS